MSRPKPTIILESVDPRTYKAEQVLRADGVYAVFYDGKPVNLRSTNSLIDYPGPKYKRVLFSNPGHAFNLSEKLNRMFKTDKFEVFLLSSGEKITERERDS